MLYRIGGCRIAAALLARYHGTEKASHVRDKLVEMTHLNETIAGV